MTDYGPIKVMGVSFSATTWPLRTEGGQPARRARDGHLVLGARGAIYYCGPGGAEEFLAGHVHMTPAWEDTGEAVTEADWLKAFADFEASWKR